MLRARGLPSIRFNPFSTSLRCVFLPGCTKLGHLSGSMLKNVGPFHHLTSLTRSEGLHPLEEVLYDVMGTPAESHQFESHLLGCTVLTSTVSTLMRYSNLSNSIYCPLARRPSALRKLGP